MIKIETKAEAKARREAQNKQDQKVALQVKPFTAWTADDLKIWTEQARESAEESMIDEVIDVYDYADLVKCWEYVIIGNALVHRRKEAPDELTAGKLTSPAPDHVPGHCKVIAIESLTHRQEISVAEQSKYHTKMVELEKQLNAGLPHQALKIVPRPAWMNQPDYDRPVIDD